MDRLRGHTAVEIGHAEADRVRAAPEVDQGVLDHDRAGIGRGTVAVGAGLEDHAVNGWDVAVTRAREGGVGLPRAPEENRVAVARDPGTPAPVRQRYGPADERGAAAQVDPVVVVRGQ